MGEEEGTRDTFGSGTRIWSSVLGGGGLEVEAAAAATAAKPPRGAGVRAHVCADERGAGRATDARSLPRSRPA